MNDFFQPTEPFAAQTQRLVAEAQQGGGDLFDIARTYQEITPGDTESWQREWLNLAERVEERAMAALTAGNEQTAIQYFFHANQYYRQSDVFLTGNDPRKRERFLKSQEAFRAGAKLHTPPIEVISVRCGGDLYDGYFCHPVNPSPGRTPAVLFIGGADSLAEENFFHGRQILDRGWAFLLVDTPGRGSSIYLKGILTRPDYEVPVKACVDYLASRPEVDPDRIALMGVSMGGYYAPRGAAFDPRIKALVAWCGCYSILDDLYLFYEPLRPTLQRILGAKDDAQARERLKLFNMEGVAHRIACPTLITHGAHDRLMNVEGARRLYEEIGSTDKTLKIWDGPEGGTGHCNYDNWAVSIPFMLDWLAQRL